MTATETAPWHMDDFCCTQMLLETGHNCEKVGR